MRRWLSILLGLWAMVAVPSFASAQAAAPKALTVQLQAAPVFSLDGFARFWVDVSGRQTIDEVAAADDSLPWQRRLRGQQHSIDNQALWYQFDVNTTGSKEEHWYLEIRASGLDRAQLFYRDAGGRWVMQEAGDTRPVSQWPLPGRVPTFDLPLQSSEAQPARYWLRIEHARTNFAAPLRIYSLGELVASREREQFLLGVYFGLALLITFTTLAHAVAYRERPFLAYAAYVVTLTLGQAAYLGVGAQHLWDQWLRWNAMSTFVLPGISGAVGLWFVRTVLEPVRFSRKLDIAVLTLISAILLAVAVDTAVASRLTFGLVMILTFATLVSISGLIALVWRQGNDPFIRLIALGFLPVLVTALFPVARGLNLIAASDLTRYALPLGAALEMPILLYAMHLRGSRRREAKLRASMLSRTDALTGLANARAFVSRLETALIRARSQRHACALLVIDLANYPALEREFGAEMAERALVVAASHLRQVISDIDVASRIGERSFAIVLEGPTTALNAQMCAQHLVARGLGSSTALPVGTTLKFHVAVGMLTGQEDAASSLAQLRDVALEADDDFRKPIRNVKL